MAWAYRSLSLASTCFGHYRIMSLDLASFGGSSLMTQPGGKILCSECGRESVAKLQRTMDGWRATSECLVCALCGAVISVPVSDDVEPPTPDSGATALTALADLLGEAPAARQTLEHDIEEHFCRDCCHFLLHPFLSRCLLHDRPTEPMDDCADFAARPPDEKRGESNDCPV